VIPLVLLCALASGQVLAVRAGRIHTGTGETIEEGVLLVEGGRVRAIGKGVAIPAGASVLDAGDAVLIPGLVAADSALAEGGADAVLSISPHYRAVEGFDPFANPGRILASGITTAYVSPGRNRLLSGRGAVVRLAGPAPRVLLPEADLRLAAGEASERPPEVFEPPIPPTAEEPILPARRQLPGTRLGTFLALREAIAKAKEWRAAYGRPGGPKYDPVHEGLAQALEAGLPWRIACVTPLDVEGALDFAEEAGLRAILDGGAESWRFAPRLARARIPVVLDVAGAPGRRPFEYGLSKDAPRWTVEGAGRLAAAGVTIALAPAADVALPDLPLLVGLAIRGGLDRGLALRAVTSQAAQILGVADRVGSLEPGKDADFVVLSGEPFAPTTHALETYVRGERVYARARPAALVVRAGTVFTAAGASIRDGAVLVEEGKVAAVGPTVPTPPGARVIDAGPRGFVTPGLIDGYSHLGLEGDRTVPSAGLPVALASSPGKRGFLEAAAAGVTTILMGPVGASAGGSQVAAIKTGARSRPAQILRETAAIRLDWRGGDRGARPGAVRDLLKSAKEYADRWDRYAEDLKKAVAEKDKDGQEQKPAPTEETRKPDPITGTWEGTIEAPPVPRPIRVVVKMRLSGTEVSGSLSVPDLRPGEIPFAGGRFEGGRLAVSVTTPFGAAQIEATVDREDHLAGTVTGPMGAIPFEMTRTEKEAAAPTARPKRKKGPEEPPFNEDLEPFRKLLKKEIVALVDVGRTDEIEAALGIFAEFGLPVVLFGAEDGWRIAAELASRKIGVVLPPEFVRRVEEEEVNLPDRLARAGVPVAFRTESEGGTRDLPIAPLAAVSRGMDPGEALRAVTIHPARLYRLDDRVGSLEAGRDGDLVVWSGDPFDPSSRILAVVADGEVLERNP
jgi:imidazolonepropionase-like amidohydrolase